MKTTISNVNIGNAGEYYVAAELERRGFVVAVPMSNVDNFDILAINKNAPYNQYAIQVKTTTKKGCWLLSKKNESIVGDNIFYVFVRLIGEEQPQYFIYPSFMVAESIKKNHQEWLTKPGKNGQIHKESNIREFNVLDEYKNKWCYFI